ncbi:hypothetical protein RchiOBHm_Chr1g0377281 [Rosa chinensis]|uniref:Uncharacterized protein n=1 Tax=Rosa chinensis TaxID=74649 RepID=A0A2P6SN21_ROSCH|nr:hypothetical protein RchiOBHm_Chr1g0377281 [Rosa chinensis]
MKKARCFSLFPWIYFSTISLIDHHHFHVAAPSCFAFISSFLFLFHILQITFILHFHYFSSTHHFTLLFLPYINTFSSHSKTHSFIHFIFLSHHFLSIFLSHHFLYQFLHPFHLLCLSISFPFSLHPLVHSTFQARPRQKKNYREHHPPSPSLKLAFEIQETTSSIRSSHLHLTV